MIGFGQAADVTEHALRTRVNQTFAPEFLNRLTAVIMCPPLTQPTVLRIVERELCDVASRPGLRRVGLRLEAEPAAVEILARKGFSREHGARPVEAGRPGSGGESSGGIDLRGSPPSTLQSAAPGCGGDTLVGAGARAMASRGPDDGQISHGSRHLPPEADFCPLIWP